MNQNESRFQAQSRAYRNPSQIISHWKDAGAVDPEMLRARTRGGFWDLLASLRVNLLLSREYENFILCLGGGAQSYMPLPHPSGIAYDPARGSVFVASTRNPNELFEFRPLSAPFPRSDRPTKDLSGTLVPSRTFFYPGSLYLHDLAPIGGKLYGNAVGHNAVVALKESGWEHAWWPESIDSAEGPKVDANFLQLNSIAAGPTLEESFFSASCESIGRRRPGHLDFPVKGRGVIFSGRTRGVVARGATRPHSARFCGRRLLFANSGYGELCEVVGPNMVKISKHRGWTRGLAVVENLAFVGVSRVLPRFKQYAPGVEYEGARCGIDAVDLKSGAVVASIRWKAGNQIFAIEAIPDNFAAGLLFKSKHSSGDAQFYAFEFRNPQ